MFADTGLARATTYSYAIAAPDAAGNVSTLSAPVSVTTPALVISNVAASSITASTATISWTTDVSANGQVEYGPTTGYGQQSSLDQALLTSHFRLLTGLTSNTTYHYPSQVAGRRRASRQLR